MNIPAIAKKTFEELKYQTEFLNIVKTILEALRNISNPLTRATVVHELVDEYNQEVFNHPLVQKFSPCKEGCSGCCHTQVSVTEDEADLLVLKINEGLRIDLNRLKIQYNAKNESSVYYKLKYEDRKCIFLDEKGACQVYENRPSVCRTNAVIGSKEQCDTSVSVQPTRLVKTPQADMVIYASFLFAKSSGTLPYMIGKRLGLDCSESQSFDEVESKLSLNDP